MTTPDQFPRRTPLRTALDRAGASWAPLGDAAIADGLGSAGDARHLAMADLSPLPRLGFKGRETIAAMQKRGVVVEAQPNRAFRQPDGGLCLVLAPGEVILLGSLAGNRAPLDDLLKDWTMESGERTYPLLRGDSHAYFLVTGSKSPDLFAKICGVDLRPDKFADLSIAQTSVAKLSAIVVRADIGGTLAFHILADSASALYFWECLTDAALEFGARVVGHQAIIKLGSG